LLLHDWSIEFIESTLHKLFVGAAHPSLFELKMSFMPCPIEPKKPFVLLLLGGAHFEITIRLFSGGAHFDIIFGAAIEYLFDPLAILFLGLDIPLLDPHLSIDP